MQSIRYIEGTPELSISQPFIELATQIVFRENFTRALAGAGVVSTKLNSIQQQYYRIGYEIIRLEPAPGPVACGSELCSSCPRSPS